MKELGFDGATLENLVAAAKTHEPIPPEAPIVTAEEIPGAPKED